MEEEELVVGKKGVGYCVSKVQLCPHLRLREMPSLGALLSQITIVLSSAAKGG